MPKVLLVGATGLLGPYVNHALQIGGHNVITHALNSLAEINADFSIEHIACDVLNKIKPDVIVNLAGQISVDLCQINPHVAYMANTKIVENIAAWMKVSKVNSHLVQISTDHVYDGEGSKLESQVTLLNNYAFSKYAGELAALSVSSTILRTNFIGRSKVEHRESLTDWVYRSLKSNMEIEVLRNVYFNPLSMFTLSSYINKIISIKPIGVFNVGSKMGMSKAEFDFEFAKHLKLPLEKMTSILYEDAKFLKAPRPKNMIMDCKKIENILGFEMPYLFDEIEYVAKQYKN